MPTTNGQLRPENRTASRQLPPAITSTISAGRLLMISRSLILVALWSGSLCALLAIATGALVAHLAIANRCDQTIIHEQPANK